MKMKIVVLIVVAVAVGAVFWLKTRAPEVTVDAKTETGAIAAELEIEKRAKVLLFADPREEDADCGCADIIKMARATKNIPGIAYQEVDSRSSTDESDLHKIRISPTLIILDRDDKETNRFEGESHGTIDELKAALDALKPSAGSSSKGTPQ